MSRKSAWVAVSLVCGSMCRARQYSIHERSRLSRVAAGCWSAAGRAMMRRPAMPRVRMMRWAMSFIVVEI